MFCVEIQSGLLVGGRRGRGTVDIFCGHDAMELHNGDDEENSNEKFQTTHLFGCICNPTIHTEVCIVLVGVKLTPMAASVRRRC